MELCSASSWGVLLDSKVPEAQAKWLIGKGITTVASFNDLADTLRQEKLTEEQQGASIWEFLHKHRTLMLAYAMAAAPEWASADLSLLLEYHDYVVSKALETDREKRPQLRSIIQADHETRGRWMLYLRVRIVTKVCQTQ